MIQRTAAAAATAVARSRKDQVVINFPGGDGADHATLPLTLSLPPTEAATDGSTPFSHDRVYGAVFLAVHIAKREGSQLENFRLASKLGTCSHSCECPRAAAMKAFTRGPRKENH